MIIAIAGGTGVLGRKVAGELQARGHEVRVLSRGSRDYRVDLRTGEGLDTALRGCDVVVDASNAASKAAETLVAGSRRLLAAGQAAGVRHHVCVSIVGCELVPIGYYKVKVDQERVVEEGPVPWTIVRATQFHEYVVALLEQAGRWRMRPVVSGVPVQTVACDEVARAVADVAEAGPRRKRVEVAGPEIVDMRELIRVWRSVAGRPSLPLPLPLFGKMGEALRGGALTTAHPDVRGQIRFGTWLASEVK